MIAGFDKPTTRRRNEYVLRVVRANWLEKSLRRNARRAPLLAELLESTRLRSRTPLLEGAAQASKI